MALLARVAVRSLERLSPSFLRLELAGPQLVDLADEQPLHDIRFKLLFPSADGGLPELPEPTWWRDFQALPETTRGHLRTYTIRAVRGVGAAAGVVVDVVLHPGAHGPGSAWAAAARVGDQLLAVLPRRGEEWGGTEWRPGPADRVLLVGDETAVPAICSILESLPDEARGTALLEVPSTADVLDVRSPVGLRVRWLPRDGVPVGSLTVPAAVSAVSGDPLEPAQMSTEVPAEPSAAEPAPEPDGDLVWETPAHSASGEPVDAGGPADGLYAWIAGESTMVRTLRRHLVTEVGLRRDQVSFMGYWREGVSMRA